MGKFAISGKDGHDRLSVTGSGAQRSLMLTINIEHYDFYRDREPGGLFLIVHGQDQTPVKIQPTFVPPGFSTHIKVDKRRIYNLEAPYETKCGNVELKYFQEYSKDACWLEQLTDFVNANCSCKLPFMPGDDIPLCEGAMLRPAWMAWEDFEKKKEWQEKCPLPCVMEEFPSATSRTLFPSRRYANELKELMEKKFPKVLGPLSKAKDVTRFMRDNLVRLIVFYDNMSYEISKQQPSYDFAFFLGDIGGQIGFFVGAGAMSYFELIDCFGMMFHSKFFERFRA